MEESPYTANNIPPRWSGLRTRVISGVVMACIVLAALWLGGWIFIAVVTAAALQMIREWDALTANDPNACKFLGVAYVAIPAASLIWLRQLQIPGQPYAGMEVVIYALFVVWATDIGAFFAGRRIGGPKLAPSISPNKTWAGLGGGMVAAAIVGGLCSLFTPYPPSWIACMDLGVLLALISQGGDLFESWLKRRVGAKDSGSLIPGHGGLLDRVDGLIFTLPVFTLLLALSGHMP